MEETAPTSAVSQGVKTIYQNSFLQTLFTRFSQRWKTEPFFKFVMIGTTLYICVRVTRFNKLAQWPINKLVKYCMEKFRLCRTFIVWTGEVEPELPFGRLGYTRCLHDDEDVLEKFAIPLNVEKCLRDGIQYTPIEFYEHFDLNAYDPKDIPLVWSYRPVTDPTLIMPIGWYNDLSGENQEYELFCRYMRLLGYLPPGAYEELYNHCSILLLRSNQSLIRSGDPDDKMYIVIHGAIDIFSNRVGPFNEYVRIQTTLAGGQIGSLFSIIDAIAGYARPIQSIHAVSKLTTTKVLIFPVAAIKDFLMRHPETVVSAVKRMLESGYRFQYQILHLAMRLTNIMSSLNAIPLFDPPEDVKLPEPGKHIPNPLRQDAITAFMNFLDIDDFDFLNMRCEVMLIEPEEVCTDLEVIKQSILNQPVTAYKFVYVGKLEEFHLKSNLTPMEKQARRKPKPEEIISEPLIRIVSGEGVGGLTGILGYSNVLFFRCIERSIVVTLNQGLLQELLEKKPYTIIPIVYMTVSRMSPLVRAMDFAMEWSMAKEGQYIYHKEQMCYDSYLILSGRARAYQLDSETQQKSIIEYKQNDWIGLSDSLLQAKRRSKTCVVIRATEFIKIPNDLLRHIVINYASAAQVMLDFLVNRSEKSRKNELLDGIRVTEEKTMHINTIALIPAHEGLPYSVLASEIKRHFIEYGGTCLILTYTKTLAAIQKEDVSEKDQFILEMYILHLLRQYDLVIFICVPRMHYWNRFCSGHSEVMFTIGCSHIPNISTVPPDYEVELVGKSISSRRKELLLLHKSDVPLPRNTKEWLFCRDWLHFHHHIRLPDKAFLFPGDFSEEELEENYGDCLNRPIELNSDLSRFGRWLSNRTIGVLFGSGGSRIGAQLGMLQAVTESKHIPIDMVVGTGSGFLLAALYAIHQDYSKVQELVERIFRDFRDLSRLRWDDVTLPYITLGNGKRILVYCYELFGSVQLEDAWIPICCVTTNVTTQDVRVDRCGPVWAYARASLTHMTYSPPISDPIDGDYICNGSHANSLPQDVIKEYGAEYIIAFNTVGGKFKDEMKADPNVSVLRFIKKTISTFIKQLGLANPSIQSIYRQLASTQTHMYAMNVEAISRLEFAVFVRPPVEHLPSQEWKHLPILHRVGYFYMKAILDRNPYTDDIPFHIYWRNIRNTSYDMASEGGRDVSSFKTNTE